MKVLRVILEFVQTTLSLPNGNVWSVSEFWSRVEQIKTDDSRNNGLFFF